MTAAASPDETTAPPDHTRGCVIVSVDVGGELTCPTCPTCTYPVSPGQAAD